ncbi:MAG: Arginine N-methyltransferase 2 [Claussenomyces sp. TS43310]|nr:MAG: Arginine N-methyltransferase 2 [Claussenomyces sp. TS43310]
MDPDLSIDLDTTTQEILLAASNHDVAALKPFFRVPGAASVQDPETGFTPLHAAIAACGPVRSADSDSPKESAPVREGDSGAGASNGELVDAEDAGHDEVDMERAKDTVRELFLAGAIWNDLDVGEETPGCLAWRLGQKELYELVVEAGVRAEMLMNLMGGYERLQESDADDDDADEGEEQEEGSQEEDSDMIVEQTAGPGVQPETAADDDEKKDVNSADYLRSDLTFQDDKLLDADANGVMMSWETSIMSLTASLLAPSPGLRILNIGFGMGIIDRLFAATSPSAHHIIEAHPAVLARLHDDSSDFGHTFDTSWRDAAVGNNVVHAGRWQDVVPQLLEKGEVFDAIYFDTFGEDYAELKRFFADYVVGLLDENGRFSFFNGLGADRRVCYDVYCRVADLDLSDAGFQTEWKDVEVGDLGAEGEKEWAGVRRRYWTLDNYRLPVCRFLG